MTNSREASTCEDVVLVEREHLAELLLWATHQPAGPVVKNAALHLERSLTAPEPPAGWFDAKVDSKVPRWRWNIVAALASVLTCAVVVFVMVGVAWAMTH